MSIRSSLFTLAALGCSVLLTSEHTLADELLSKISMKDVFTSQSASAKDSLAQSTPIDLAIVASIEKALSLGKVATPKQSSPGSSSSKSIIVDRLPGRWTAKTAGGDVFAMELKTANRFALVHLSAGKSTVSQGSYKREANRLTLSSKAAGSTAKPLTLSGELRFNGNDSFTLKLGQTELVFRRSSAQRTIDPSPST